MKLRRDIEVYRKSDPKAMAKQSEAAIFYALDDMRHDLLLLHDENEQLRKALSLTSPKPSRPIK